ncbi:unnamed protein product, partial [Protopolystoma xenopodis]
MKVLQALTHSQCRQQSHFGTKQAGWPDSAATRLSDPLAPVPVSRSADGLRGGSSRLRRLLTFRKLGRAVAVRAGRT